MKTLKRTLYALLIIGAIAPASAWADPDTREIIFEPEDIEGALLAPNEGLSTIELDTGESLLRIRDDFFDRMMMSVHDL